MKHRKWKATLKTEKEFQKALNVLCDLFVEIAEKANGDINKYTKLMNDFQNSPQYERYINSAVRRMITPISVANKATWRRAAKISMRGRFFYRLLQDEIEEQLHASIESQIIENANLIRTLPNDVALKVTNNVKELTYQGLRATEIAKVISTETDKHSRASARLIARTEVSKATTALTKARCEGLDIKWYVWRTSLDGDRVRKSHRLMEDVLISWSNPPSPEALAGEKDVGNYHAGNIWNCRCYPEPLLEIDDVKWPHKVYYQGTIQNMSKAQFESLL